ncbi:MAG: alkane 1-monooxygenase [Bacteroidia bacterium]
MKHLRLLKYLAVLSLPLMLWPAFAWRGGWSFLPLLYVFGVIPLLELLMPPDPANLSRAEEDLARNNPRYDWMIYLTVPLLYAALGVFFVVLARVPLQGYEVLGLVLAIGIMCGTFGINVGHELGHRSKAHERLLAKVALLSSLYMHFYIEHNRGHHRHVSTPEDPASARRGETVFAFWLRSVAGSYRSAWRLEDERLRRQGQGFWSWHNEMLRFQVIQLGWLLGIGLLGGPRVLLAYLGAATVGFLLLETVNYIEHYGLQRRRLASGAYERVLPQHSWNSDHSLGRILLFELSRHSDHHYLASRKYQILRHHDDSPQMPTGYPGMIVLALLPPLWFAVMHPRLDRLEQLRTAPATT